jgi:PDZ domain-containing protein
VSGYGAAVQRLARFAVIALALAAGALGILAGVASILPSDDVLFLPTPARPVAPIVHVQGEHPDPAPGGPGIYYVAISEKKATRLESILGDRIHDGADVVPERALIPEGSTPEEQDVVDKADMADSQTVAAAVAQKALGRNVVITPHGVRVVDTAMAGGSPAREAGIKAGNIITAIDGRTFDSLAGMRPILQEHRPGDTVTVHYRATDGEHDAKVTLRGDQQEPDRALLGITAEDAQTITLAVPVTYTIGNVEGPSAGLAFALEVYAALGDRNLTRGHRVAATGTMALDGTVGPIGGEKQKAIGAGEAHADVFLVPRDNYPIASRNAPAGMHVIAVTSFQDALAQLRRLPPK